MAARSRRTSGSHDRKPRFPRDDRPTGRIRAVTPATGDLDRPAGPQHRAGRDGYGDRHLMAATRLHRVSRTDRPEGSPTVHGPFAHPLAGQDRLCSDAGVSDMRIRTVPRVCAHSTGSDRRECLWAGRGRHP